MIIYHLSFDIFHLPFASVFVCVASCGFVDRPLFGPGADHEITNDHEKNVAMTNEKWKMENEVRA